MSATLQQALERVEDSAKHMQQKDQLNMLEAVAFVGITQQGACVHVHGTAATLALCMHAIMQADPIVYEAFKALTTMEAAGIDIVGQKIPLH